MSRYKVETGSLYTLARAMDIGAGTVDQAMRQSVAPACRRIVYQRGAQVWADAQRLVDALRNMNALKSDIELLASALRIVAETASPLAYPVPAETIRENAALALKSAADFGKILKTILFVRPAVRFL